MNMAAPGLCICVHQRVDGVDTATGDFEQTSTDIAVATFGPPLEFDRTYDTSLAEEQSLSQPGPLGYGWTDNWNTSLKFTNPAGAVTVEEANGSEVTFTLPVSGSCQAPNTRTAGDYCSRPQVTADLTVSGGNYTLVTHPYASYTYNSTGQLQSESAPGDAAAHAHPQLPEPGQRQLPIDRACVHGRHLRLGAGARDRAEHRRTDYDRDRPARSRVDLRLLHHHDHDLHRRRPHLGDGALAALPRHHLHLRRLELRAYARPHALDDHAPERAVRRAGRRHGDDE